MTIGLHEPGRNRFGLDPWLALMLGCCLLAVGLVFYFDRGPNLPSNDDWLYAWSAGQLRAGHGLQLHFDQAPLAFLQDALGALAVSGKPDYRALRFLALPFMALAGISVYRSARILDIPPRFAALGSAVLLSGPVYLSLATSFMTEPFYVGLLVAAAAAGVRWFERGSGRIELVAWTLLAAAERQHAVGIPLAAGLVVLLLRRRRRWSRRDQICLVGLIAAALAPGALAVALHSGGYPMTAYTTGVPPAGNLILPVLFLPIMMGLGFLPFLGALMLGHRPSQGSRLLRLFGFLALGWLVATWGIGASTLTGPYLTASGLGPVTMSGAKPELWGGLVFSGVAFLAAVTALLLFAFRSVRIDPAGAPAGRTFLILLAMTQLLPTLLGGHNDRYYVPISACLIPLAAGVAARVRRQHLALALGALGCVAGVALFAIGEQDYQAWQAARATLLESVYRTYDPAQVNAGFEANGVYWELARPNVPMDGIRVVYDGIPILPAAAGPPAASVRIGFAGPNDPRPGVAYWSLAPGKAVVLSGP